MQIQAQVEQTIRAVIKEVGFSPDHVLQIKPKDGGWENALSFEILNDAGKRASIFRSDLEDGNKSALKQVLQDMGLPHCAL